MQSLVSVLDEKISLLSFWGIVGVYIAILSVIAVISLWRKWLTLSGVVAAFVLGFIVLYFGGLSAFMLFFFFFFVCSVLSKIKRSYNKREQKGSRRDMAQVVANGLPAVIALFLTHSPSFYRVAIVAYSASLAEAAADTFSSTFGIMSRHNPLSIITLTPVPKGISGGVTILGLLAGALGAVLIAILHFVFLVPSWHHVLIVSGSGFLSSVIDSVLGATIQEHFLSSDGCLTEKEYESGVKNKRVRGIPGFNNDIVNLASGVLALSLSLLLASIQL